jgi:glycosyltransferase involved in cell wall biosynthesis
MKRILIFSVAFHPFIGGAEIAVKEITDRLLPQEFEFHLLTVNLDGRQKKTEKIGNIVVHRIGSGFFGKFLFPFLGFRYACKLHKEQVFDSAWSIMASQASIAAVKFKKKYPAVKLVLTVQEGDDEEHLKRYVFGNAFLYKILIRPWHVGAFRKADLITAISSHLAERSIENGATAPIYVIPNGVDMSLFSQPVMQERIEELMKTLGKTLDDRFIITTSRLVKKNAVDDLLRALALLPVYFKLLVLGIGPEMRSLKHRATAEGVADRVKFIGFVGHKEIPAYLAVSDVFVRPSLSEGMGNSFIEAMAARIPVVATPVGGIPDFIFDVQKNYSERPTGWLANPRDPEDLAEKISSVFENKELLQFILNNAFELVKAKYDWDIIAQKMKEIAFI